MILNFIQMIYIYYQYKNSVSIMSLAVLDFPYSVGKKLTIKFLGSLPIGSNSPFVGVTLNSGSLSLVK
jgi:hypothetical protein